MNLTDFQYIGETFALATALVWAFAVILLKKSGEKVHPLALNLFKTILALALVIPTIYILGGTLFYPASTRDYAILFLSGVLGIGVGDTLFFKSLNTLGASLNSIAGCSYSPIIIGLSVCFLGESFSTIQIIGTLLILTGIVATSGEIKLGNISKRNLIVGLTWAILSELSLGIGIVMIKPILDNSPVLWTGTIRLVGGLFAVSIFTLIHPRRKSILETLTHSHHRIYTISGSFTGTYLAMMLWLAGMKYTQASTAAVLNQTSHIWIFILAGIFLKEKINKQRMIAIVLASVGVYIVAMG